MLSRFHLVYFHLFQVKVKVLFYSFICFVLESVNVMVPSILNERCDGNRNILHAVVNMCTPTSNKDMDNGE